MPADPYPALSPAVIQAVQTLARHALPAFGTALLLLLAGITTFWLAIARYGTRRDTSRHTPLASLLAYLTASFAAMAGAAALFAEIAENVGDGRRLGQLDVMFSSAVGATVAPTTLGVFAALTHLGDPTTLAVLCVAGAIALLSLKKVALCTAWVAAIAGNAVLNPALKGIFARARPVHETGLATPSGYSFPSGHSSGAVVAYGMLAYVLMRLLPPAHAAWRLPAVLAAATIALTVCVSRIFLRAHFPSDVLAGIASGAIWLALCIGAVELASYRQIKVRR